VYSAAVVRRALIAVVAAVALLATGCFPHNKKHRRIAYAVELGVLGTGVAVLALSPPGADCDRDDDACLSRANTLSGIGVFLLLAGLGGLVATISSAEEAATPPPKKLDEEEPPAPAPVKATKPPEPEKTPEPETTPAPEPAPEPPPAPAPAP
jgi:hypothetical protein